jgi:WD40 repeat protein
MQLCLVLLAAHHSVYISCQLSASCCVQRRRKLYSLLLLLLLAGRVLFWELVEAMQVESLQAHTGVVCGLAMHPKDPIMVTCSVDGVAKVWV